MIASSMKRAVEVINEILMLIFTWSKLMRSLFVFSGNPSISLVPGSQTFVSFTRHSGLDAVMHLFPENMIVACDKKIPGISEQHVIVNEGS